MKSLKTALGVLCCAFLLFGCQGTEEIVSDRTVSLQSTDEGPFQYFQIMAYTDPGFSGAVFLNNVRVYEVAGEGGSTSNNQAQDLIKNGENTIVLQVDGVEDGTDPVVEIGLHAMNESAFPNDENRVIDIEWQASENTVPETVEYQFQLQR